MINSNIFHPTNAMLIALSTGRSKPFKTFKIMIYGRLSIRNSKPFKTFKIMIYGRPSIRNLRVLLRKILNKGPTSNCKNCTHYSEDKMFGL